jgi:molybdopterin-containing oxidoreductase family membrane subunit
VENTRTPSKPVPDGIESSTHTYASLTDKISNIVLKGKTPKGWIFGFGLAFALFMVFLYATTYLLARGVGIWGINVPIGWGFDIVNFVWWIGIGHAGTLISAILLLLKQQWRTSINRFAEAMTLFAVACAGVYPLLHMGRPWFAYWMLPLPNTMGIWPQFRSPLVWDLFAVSTYATVSLLFWYVGLIPDAATMRDRSKGRIAQLFYGLLAMGWRGSARHWQRYETAYLLLAGLSTPLVLSVHTIVSLDFAAGIIPGWHSTIFPPYFVAGAVYSGFAMVLVLILPIRRLYKLKDFVTSKHLDNMAKVMLASGLIVAYGYLMEIFYAWYSATSYEQYMVENRFSGPYAPLYWTLILANVVIPQALWVKRVRMNTLMLFAIALVINVGMWLERFIIIVTSLHRDYLPASWDMYYPTVWDWATYVGTMGLFFSLLFIFIRLLPMISIFEMRTILPKQEGE